MEISQADDHKGRPCGRAYLTRHRALHPVNVRGSRWNPAPSSASHSLGTCPYPLCRCATSSLPLLAFGHFPLTGGIGPLIRGVGPPRGRFIGRDPVCRSYGGDQTGIVGLSNPGAVAGPQLRQILQTQGPVARRKFRHLLRLCAPEMLQHLSGGVFVKGGPGGGRIWARQCPS